MNKRTLLAFGAAFALVTLPAIALAATAITDLSSLIEAIKGYIGSLVYLIMAFAVIVFLWNVAQYIRSTDADGKKEAAQYILWSLVGLFVMVSVWALVSVISTTFFGSNNADFNPLSKIQGQ